MLLVLPDALNLTGATTCMPTRISRWRFLGRRQSDGQHAGRFDETGESLRAPDRRLPLFAILSRATRTCQKWTVLRLPTLCECSSTAWFNTVVYKRHSPRPRCRCRRRAPSTPPTSPIFDAWRYPLPLSGIDKTTGALSPYVGPRVSDDVILTNVIGFDVKAWDPNAPVFSTSIAGSPLLLPGDANYYSVLTAPRGRPSDNHRPSVA